MVRNSNVFLQKFVYSEVILITIVIIIVIVGGGGGFRDL